MVFIDNYLAMCAEKGIAPTALLRELGISHSLLAKWKGGVNPSNATKLKIADYFGITVAELNGEAQKNEPVTKSDELERKARFNAVMLLLSDEKQAMVEDFAAKLLRMQ